MPDEGRTSTIVDVLVDAFEPLMVADPDGFRTKFRKMAADPFAFYRGSACLFYADMADLDDPWADERSSRVWVHGDLHAENFGTYMNSEGTLVFDVNDFDEAYVGHFSWDLRRFVASLALMGWQKALPDRAVRRLARRYLQAYVEQVHHYVELDDDDDFALRLDNTTGAIQEILQQAKLSTRLELLNRSTEIHDRERRFADGPNTRRLDDTEQEKVLAAYRAYLDTIPEHKRQPRDVFYEVKDVVGRSGFGIGSAGLPAYNVLIEGFNQALENDVVLSMKLGNVAAPSRIVADERVRDYFENDGHRTVTSQRALQAHADPYLGYTTVDGAGFVVGQLSPYENDLDWDEITEPDEIAPVLDDLGRATAKIHCASDEDSEQTLVDFQTEEAIAAVIDGRHDEFVDEIVEFGVSYAATARRDHALFVDAFREGAIANLSAT
ncbi:MAG TPA: DUF2252 domain-containing protein [Nocardioidaceae bacterium]|nr:DUF2252 domain-containing protein [Nocardioidaceae bacterium]